MQLRWKNNGTIFYERDIHSACFYYNGVIEDSSKVILEDSAIVEIPDNSILELRCAETKLVMGENSELKFGKNSKLILKDGASIYANGSRFTSLHPDSTWDGIYLQDMAYDTLKNCVIENAYNGINVINKISAFITPAATEISNCTFRNTTSSELLNFVYVNNSANVLVKDCSSEITSTGRFTAGIITKYCPAGGLI